MIRRILALGLTLCRPLLAPFIGGFIDMSYLGWRWTEYITTIMGFLGVRRNITRQPACSKVMVDTLRTASTRDTPT
jgi:MFS family permease